MGENFPDPTSLPAHYTRFIFFSSTEPIIRVVREAEY